MKNLKIYTDGGARGNPGPAATGIVIFDENDNLIALDGNFLGKATNNQAEYTALLEALQVAKNHSSKEITCYLDSELAVKQLNGEYKVKNKALAEIKNQIETELKHFTSYKFIHVYRENNKFADKMVNVILDACTK